MCVCLCFRVKGKVQTWSFACLPSMGFDQSQSLIITLSDASGIVSLEMKRWLLRTLSHAGTRGLRPHGFTPSFPPGLQILLASFQPILFLIRDWFWWIELSNRYSEFFSIIPSSTMKSGKPPGMMKTMHTHGWIGRQAGEKIRRQFIATASRSLSRKKRMVKIGAKKVGVTRSCATNHFLATSLRLQGSKIIANEAARACTDNFSQISRISSPRILSFPAISQRDWRPATALRAQPEIFKQTADLRFIRTLLPLDEAVCWGPTGICLKFGLIFRGKNDSGSDHPGTMHVGDRLHQHHHNQARRHAVRAWLSGSWKNCKYLFHKRDIIQHHSGRMSSRLHRLWPSIRAGSPTTKKIALLLLCPSFARLAPQKMSKVQEFLPKMQFWCFFCIMQKPWVTDERFFTSPQACFWESSCASSPSEPSYSFKAAVT